MSKKKDTGQSFFDSFHSFIGQGFGPTTYNVQVKLDKYEVLLAEYEKAWKKACETLTDDEIEKWDNEHDMPEEEYESRFIPNDEDWDTVNKLMQESLEQGKDLLWERYKNNIIEPLPPGCVY
jgi:hypothetical protein